VSVRSYIMGGGEPDIVHRFLVARKTGWLRVSSAPPETGPLYPVPHHPLFKT